MAPGQADDLVILRAKALARLHEKLDKDKLNPIALIASQDRTFQQSRLLEGKSTFNVSSLLRIQQSVLAKTIDQLSKPADKTDSDSAPAPAAMANMRQEAPNPKKRAAANA